MTLDAEIVPVARWVAGCKRETITAAPYLPMTERQPRRPARFELLARFFTHAVTGLLDFREREPGATQADERRLIHRYGQIDPAVRHLAGRATGSRHVVLAPLISCGLPAGARAVREQPRCNSGLDTRQALGLLALLGQVVLAVLTPEAANAQSPPPADGPRINLPASNFGSTGPDRGGLPAPAPGFARASVATNPGAPDARPVGEKTCIACHKLEVEHFTHTLHSLGLHVANRSDPGIPVCEACHGPGSEHAASPRTKGLIIGFTHDSGTPVETQTKTCLTCHKGGARDHWMGSIHQRNDLSCSDCHNPMAKFSVQGLMARSSINDTCAQCHKDILQQFSRRSHMPLPEGRISCVDCHNPHGTLNPALLKTATVNETCYQCHADKRGPFLFEHAPVRESCLNCHTPHGSNQSTLLVEPIPFLCQQCHTNILHPNDLQTKQALGTGLHPDERALGRACLTCHANIHGSNAPSGVRFHE